MLVPFMLQGGLNIALFLFSSMALAFWGRERSKFGFPPLPVGSSVPSVHSELWQSVLCAHFSACSNMHEGSVWHHPVLHVSWTVGQTLGKVLLRLKEAPILLRPWGLFRSHVSRPRFFLLCVFALGEGGRLYAVLSEISSNETCTWQLFVGALH